MSLSPAFQSSLEFAMKTFSNDAIFSAFANGVRVGKNKNRSIFIEDGVIFSYGYHWPLAVCQDGVFFVNGDKYSVTTSKQTTGLLRHLPKDLIKMVSCEEMKELAMSR